MKEYDKYLKLLKEKYPTKQSVYRELINLNAIMNLPKGTEHFMSDLHGEYDAFYHIINNCSGVIREKVAMLYGDELTVYEQQELCTLIYYPREKLSILMDENKVNDEWYRNVLNQLIQIAKLLSTQDPRCEKQCLWILHISLMNLFMRRRMKMTTGVCTTDRLWKQF